LYTYKLSTTTEEDVVGGIDKFRRKLCSLFYKLGRHFDTEVPSVWLSSKTGDESSKKKKNEIIDTEKRVAVEEPEDSVGLL
jgi:hypothetical protein